MPKELDFEFLVVVIKALDYHTPKIEIYRKGFLNGHPIYFSSWSVFRMEQMINFNKLTCLSSLPYLNLIGGVLTLPLQHFLRVNGFSNMFWGWGGEDDDMFER